MEKDRQSESLFSSSGKKNDVRHDLGTVHEAWSAERRRRIRHALMLLIPLIAVIACIIAVFLHFHPEYGPDRLSDPPIDEETYQMQKLMAEGKLPPPPPDTDTTVIYGNPDAKLQISLAKKFAEKKLLDLLFSAVDSKPSEISLKLIAKNDLDENELDFIKGSGSCMLQFNGKNSYDLTMPNGSQRTFYLDGPYEMSFNNDDLMLIIKDLHAKLYGEPKVPIFPELAQKVEALKKVPLPVKKDQQTFEKLPTPIGVE